MKKEFNKSSGRKEEHGAKKSRSDQERKPFTGKNFRKKERAPFAPGRKEEGTEKPFAKKFPDRKKREEVRSGEKPFAKKRFPERKEETGFSERKPRYTEHKDFDKKTFDKKKRFDKNSEDTGSSFERKDKPYGKPEKNTFAGKKPFQKPAPKRPRAEEDRQDEMPVKKPTSGKSIEEPMTLNKYIAHSGECSRRDAAELVKQGKVRVNGALVLEPGHRVAPGDTVTLSGKKMTPQKNLVYVLLNKPKDYITTTDDPQERKTVMDLVANSGIDRLYPVGRLDRNTTGLLLLTNDGALAHKLSHPSYTVRKVYHVTLDKNLAKTDYEKIFKGVELEDGKAEVDEIAYLENRNEIGMEIHIGRNRIVRRIFESLGYTVEKLDRVMYAGLTKKNLPRGKWRFLDEKEIIFLKHYK